MKLKKTYMKSSSYCFSDILSLQRNNNQNSREKRRCRQTQSLMALRMWASSTANALKVSSTSRPHLLHPFSFSRCLSSGIYSHTHTHTLSILQTYQNHNIWVWISSSHFTLFFLSICMWKQRPNLLVLLTSFCLLRSLGWT